MSFLRLDRTPGSFNQKGLARIFTRVEDAVNRLANRLTGNEQRVRDVLAIGQRVENVLANQPLRYEFQWYEDSGQAIGKLIVYQGWKEIVDVEARYSEYSNVASGDTWLGINDGGTKVTFETDSSLPQGGYYQFALTMPEHNEGEKKHTFAVEMRALNTRSEVLATSSMVFDTDKLPEFIGDISLEVDGWSDPNWTVYASGAVDTDCGSVYFGASATEFDPDASLVAGDFTLAETDTTSATGTSYRYRVSLGTFAADTTVYVVGACWTGTSKSGTMMNAPYARASITTPPAPGVDGISTGELTADLLADAALQAKIAIVGQHKSGDEDNTVQYAGTITYNNGVAYSMAGDGTTYQDLTPASTGLYYIFFDPDTWAGEGAAGSATQDLQLTSDKDVANAVSGKRILVGVMEKATTAGNRAFFVLTGSTAVITAPYIYAAKLSALSADMGSLTAGQIVVTTGSDKIWLNEGDDGVFAVGGSTKASAPFKVAADGTLTSTAGSVATNTSDIASLQGDMTTAQSDITTNASNISSNSTAVGLRVTKTTYEAGLDGDQFTTLSGTESGAQTEISVNTTPHALDDNDELLLYQSSDDTWKVLTVNGNHAAGVSAITIDSISLNGVSTDPILFSNKTAVGQIKVQADEIDLRVQYADVINAINISSEGITIDADNISIDGTTTFSSGYDPTERADVQRSSSAPTTRSDGSALQAGDMYTDTSNGEKPYVHTGSGWIAAYTVIDGGNITTGTIDASVVTVDNLNASNISTGTLGGITTGNLTASGIITAGTSNNVGVLDGADALWRIYAGHATPASAPFRVDQAGNLYAESATITGDFIANGNTVIDNGTGNIQNGNLTTLDITGDLTMNGGAIKVGTDVTIDASGITLDAGSTSGPAYSAATVLDFGGNLALWSYEATGIAHGVVEFTPTSTSSSFYLRMAGALGSHGTIGIQSGGNTLAVTTSGVSVVLASGDTFAVDGSAVISAADSLSALTNVHSSTDAPTDGYIMEYDTTNGWQAVAPASTHAAVTLAGSYDYLTLSSQEITLGQIDLTTDVTGVLPSANLDTDTMHLSVAQTITGAKTYTDGLTTSFGLAATSGRVQITQSQVKVENTTSVDEVIILKDDITINGSSVLTSVNNSNWSGTDLAVNNGGTGSSTASGARSNLGLGSLAVLNAIANLTDITDVSGTPADKHIIYYDAGGPNWASQTLASALADQNVSSLTNDAGYLATVAINDVSDITITSVGNGEVLWYSTGWKNGTLAEAGIAAASHTHATLVGAATDASGTPADKHLLYYDSGTPGWVSTHINTVMADASITTSQISDITTAATGITKVGTVVTGIWAASNVGLNKGGTGQSLSDPGADRIMFWDDSASGGAGAVTWLTAGTGLDISTTSLIVDSSSGAAGVTFQSRTADTTITADQRLKITVDGIDYYILAEEAP